MVDHPSPSGPAEGTDEQDTRRSRLLAVKLRALVQSHLGESAAANDVPLFPPGAAIVTHGAAWVLIDERPAHRLGSALAWALRRGVGELHVIVDADAGILARRSAGFAFPISVWEAHDRELVSASPLPPSEPSSAPAHHLALRELIAAGGATPIVEHGVVGGEVRGLEVCRVVDDPDVPDGARLEVGVGVHDREAFQMLHGDTPTIESLARVVDAVSAHRRAGAPRHPFNRMAAERYLRWQVIDEPGRLGLATVEPAEPPVPRASAVEAVPCVARGVDGDGGAVTVVCSSGVDLDGVAYA
ncbi:MAG: hypothetical protein WD225_14515, partial [Ilumatobacteraceae bacterium]